MNFRIDILWLLCLAASAVAAPRPGPPPLQIEPYVGLGHTSYRSVMAWSPDGRTLATGSFDDTVVLWDADGWKPRATLAGHRSVIVALAWSRDGRTLASSDAGDRTIVWDTATAKRRLMLVGGLQPLAASAQILAPDYLPATAAPLSLPTVGVLVTSFENRSAIVWDAVTGQRRAVLRAPGGSDGAVMAVSPDGRTLALGSADQPGGVELWDLATVKRRLHIPTRTFVTALLWSPDSRTLAIGQITSVALCDASTGRPRTVLEEIDGQQAEALAWSPDGQMFAGATGGEPQQVCLWDTRTGRRLRGIPPGSQLSGFLTLAWSPDSAILAICTGTTVTLWNAATGDGRAALLEISAPIAWNPDGRTLATAAADFPLHTAILWNGLTGEPRVYLSPRLTPVLKDGVTWSPDGRTLLTASQGGEGGTAAAWDAATGQQQTALFDDAASELQWSPNGRILASGSSDEIQLWDMPERHLRAHISGVSLAGAESQIAWKPDSSMLAVPSNRDQTLLWDAPAKREIALIPGATGPVRVLGGFDADPTYAWSPSWSPDGRTLVTASPEGDQTILLWDPATRRVRGTLRGHRSSVNAIAWSPDSRRVASGAYDGTVILWDAATGARLQTLPAPAWALWWLRAGFGLYGRWLLAWAPDGKALAAAISGSGSAWLWNPENGQLEAIIPMETQKVDALAWSPQSNLLAIAVDDHSIRLWDRRRRRSRATLRGHTGPITALAWSPDGRRLASGSIDGSVRLWSAPTGRQLVDFYTFDEGKEWLAITPQGYFAASAQGADVLQWRQGAKLWPLAKFRRRYERPDLVRKALAGHATSLHHAVCLPLLHR